MRTRPSPRAHTRAVKLALVLSAPVCACVVFACSSDSGSGTDAGPDTSAPDTGTPDTGAPGDAQPDTQAADSGCAASWNATPSVPSLLWPDGGGTPVLLHTGASGTQDYQCQGADGGVYSWVFIGPEADLTDCHAAKVGQHFASDGGPTRPEWITTDNSYVIGKRLTGYTPDGGAGSIPWLLLESVSNGGSGDLAQAKHVQRLYTDGGNAPSSTCDQNNVGAIQKVPYTADYYFYQQ